MVPEGWLIKTIGEVADVKGGKRIPKGHQLTDENTGYPYIRVTDMIDGGVDMTSIKYVPADVAPKIARYRISKEDIFITVAGTLGLVGEVPVELDGANLTENADKLTNIKCNKRFLLEVLRSPIIQMPIDEEKTHNAQPKLALRRIKEFAIPYPPLPEQKKIAQILSTWDKAITTTEQLLANSQQQKKALMQQLLTGKKRLLDKNGVRFSGEWKDVEIGKVLKEVKRPVDWDDDAEYKLLSVKRRSEGVALREVLKGSNILTKKMNVAHSGDFLISKMQIVHGAAGLVSDEFDGFHVSDSYISLIPKDENKLDIHFFAWFAKQKLMYHKAFLCSYGVHIEKMTFNFKLFLKEKIKLPVSIEEQQKIASVLSAADQEVTT